MPSDLEGFARDSAPPSHTLDWVVAALFAAIATMIGVDLISDYRHGSDLGHLTTESVVMALALAGAVAIVARMRVLAGRARVLAVELEQSREAAEQWRRDAREALDGLGVAIDRQFDRWRLTPAEREVGLLLLKGLSLKEIAQTRDVSDRTARHQAHALYRKADLSGRADLSAFFLEDLLLPTS